MSNRYEHNRMKQAAQRDRAEPSAAPTAQELAQLDQGRVDREHIAEQRTKATKAVDQTRGLQMVVMGLTEGWNDESYPDSYVNAWERASQDVARKLPQYIDDPQFKEYVMAYQEPNEDEQTAANRIMATLMRDASLSNVRDAIQTLPESEQLYFTDMAEQRPNQPRFPQYRDVQPKGYGSEKWNVLRIDEDRGTYIVANKSVRGSQSEIVSNIRQAGVANGEVVRNTHNEIVGFELPWAELEELVDAQMQRNFSKQ